MPVKKSSFIVLGKNKKPVVLQGTVLVSGEIKKTPKVHEHPYENFNVIKMDNNYLAAILTGKNSDDLFVCGNTFYSLFCVYPILLTIPEIVRLALDKGNKLKPLLSEITEINYDKPFDVIRTRDHAGHKPLAVQGEFKDMVGEFAAYQHGDDLLIINTHQKHEKITLQVENAVESLQAFGLNNEQIMQMLVRLGMPIPQKIQFRPFDAEQAVYDPSAMMLVDMHQKIMEAKADNGKIYTVYFEPAILEIAVVQDRMITGRFKEIADLKNYLPKEVFSAFCKATSLHEGDYYHSVKAADVFDPKNAELWKNAKDILSMTHVYLPVTAAKRCIHGVVTDGAFKVSYFIEKLKHDAWLITRKTSKIHEFKVLHQNLAHFKDLNDLLQHLRSVDCKKWYGISLEQFVEGFKDDFYFHQTVSVA